MRKAKFLKKFCAWMLTTATLVTSIAPSSLVYASTDSGGSDIYSERTVSDSDDTDVGKVLLKINGEGGKVTVSSNSAGKQIVTSTLNDDGEQVINVKDAANKKDKGEDNVIPEDADEEDAYALELEEPVDSLVLANIKADKGYVVSDLSVLDEDGYDVGDVEDIDEDTSKVTQEVEVTEDTQIIEVSFESIEEDADSIDVVPDDEEQLDVEPIEPVEEEPQRQQEELPEESVDVQEPQIDEEDPAISDTSDPVAEEPAKDNSVDDEEVTTVDDVQEEPEEQSEEFEKDINGYYIDKGLGLESMAETDLAMIEEAQSEERAGAKSFHAGHKYLSEIFGIDREKYYDWLEYNTDEDTSIYLGTPYNPNGAGANPKGDPGTHQKFTVQGNKYQIPASISRYGYVVAPSGSISPGLDPGVIGMQCTGFVWHALQMAMSASGASDAQHRNLFNYVWDTYNYNGWAVPGNYYDYYRYAFPGDKNGYDDMLNSGVLEYGDIIYSLSNYYDPSVGRDHHIGIYVGNGNPDTPKKYNRYWHSGHYSTHSQIPTGNVIGKISGGQGNMVSNIIPKSDVLSAWMVIKMFPEEEEQFGKIRVKKKSELTNITD